MVEVAVSNETKENEMTGIEHKCFTVGTTNYVRNLSVEDKNDKFFAVHHQVAPKKVEGGTALSMIFPFLIVANYFTDQKGIAEKVARILEKHWNDEDAVS